MSKFLETDGVYGQAPPEDEVGIDAKAKMHSEGCFVATASPAALYSFNET